jgi:hypothetical protein
LSLRSCRIYHRRFFVQCLLFKCTSAANIIYREVDVSGNKHFFSLIIFYKLHFLTYYNTNRINMNILWRIARQQLAECVPERYAVNENRRPLLDNGFSYHGFAGASGATQTWKTVEKPLELVHSMRTA